MKLLGTLLACTITIAGWIALAVYLALTGLWMPRVAEQDDTAAFYNWAVAEIKTKKPGNSALLLLQDGEIIEQYFSGAEKDIDADTLFPTASFSKWVTALSVMSLVEKNQIDLDLPVSDYLSRWQLPDSEFDNQKVTIRRLLSHTAGLTDGLGFGDYGADEVIPATALELRQPRASSGEQVLVAVGKEPGAEFQYSGGGYLILQLLVEEVTGLTFSDYVQRNIFTPVGMTRSSYAFLGNQENASSSYNTDGSVAPTFQYASPAATGLASSANDLAKLVKTILSAVNDTPLKPSTIRAMREPHGYVMGTAIWGLGTILYAPTANGDYVFGHDGVNDPAINATVRLNPATSDGIVMLVSGHPTLASNIGSEWVLWQTGYPDFLQTERALKSAVLPALAGSFIIILAFFLWSRKRR